jgi:hypothetical protein
VAKVTGQEGEKESEDADNDDDNDVVVPVLREKLCLPLLP